MRARFRMVSLVALACAALAGSAGVRATEAPARLLEVRPRLDAGRTAVLIEASEPVAYATSQPDPLTVLVDLRHVTGRGAANRLADRSAGPVAVVDLEEATAPDGAALTRVRLGLAEPVEPRVRSDRNTIVVEFGPNASGTRPAARAEQQADMSGVTKLSAVSMEEIDGTVRVTLKADGPLVPSTTAEAKDPPPRIVIDFPGVLSTTPGVTQGTGDLRRVRVAANSVSPLVTRVVFDLKRRVPYRVDASRQDQGEIVVTLGAPPTAAAGPPAVPAPRRADAPVPPPVPAPSRAEPPRVPAPVMGATPPAPKTPAAEPAPAPKLAGAEPAPAAKPAPPGTTPSSVVPAPGRTAAGFGPGAQAGMVGTEQTAERKFTGHPVSLDFQGVDLRAVLRTFAEITGLNIVIDPQVQGSVDVTLRDVPWDQALDIILRANQLGYTVDGTIVRVAPLKTLAEEESQRRRLAEERALAGELKVLTRTLSYAKAGDVADLIVKSTLTQRGTVQVDDRTNTLIITDLPVKLDLAGDLLTTLDRPEPQVEIEARIVQTTREFARSIGVQWGFNGYVSPAMGNTTGLAFPNQGSLTGRTGRLQGDTVQGDPSTQTAVNLAAVNATSAVGLALGSVNGAFNLDVALTALERAGKGRILSTPRVSTQNNIEAEVTQGVQIPIQTVANQTVTVQFKDAALTLKVKPQITAANTVIMKITLENASPDYSRQVNGIPPIDTQRAITEVLVSDGNTTVIGGIFVSREATINDRTPGLWRLPLLGWLFRRDSMQDESRELLIFITPRIIKG